MQCEMCGNPAGRTKKVLVDRSVLQVCPNCERFGQVLDGPAARAPVVPGNVGQAMERRRLKQTSKDLFSSEQMSLEMVEDFAARIRSAREAKGWSRQDLGGKVGEREPTVARIEAGALRPSDEVAKRMERELGIKLFEPVTRGTTKSAPTRGLTLGDMLRDAARKKQG